MQLLPPDSTSVGTTLDANLCQRVDAYTREDADYWSFRGSAAREHSHGYFQYPAMMVPEMISDLISSIIEVKPSTKSICDPYAGSGTVLTEAMLQECDFLARDVNPLAILLCKVKRGPFMPGSMSEKARELQARIKADRKDRVDVAFKGRDKWFTAEAALELSKIRRAIQLERSIWARRFFWVVLAETVRTSSNSRTSTFKLHIRSEADRASRKVNPVDTFNEVLIGNLTSLATLTNELVEKGQLNHGHYKGSVLVELRDARSKHPCDDKLYDLLVTSPPYGDNVTTVPYGQHAYLPLQWIDLSDIDQKITADCLKSTHEIDARSLGGSRRDAIKDTAALRELSPSFAATIKVLEREPIDRRGRVAAFIRDLNSSLDPILGLLKRNAYLIWTVGNRQVAKKPVPLDAILSELLASKGVVAVANFNRDIPTKRMAVKNSITDTMDREAVLVFRKDCD
jgi:hypothetical protein